MAFDAEDYQKNLPAARWQQRLKRLDRLAEGKLRRGPHGAGSRGSAALRHPRKKKGRYLAA